MIYRKSDLETEIRPAMGGGNGELNITHIADASDLADKSKLFAILELKPHCSVGYHVHENDTEIYHVLSGCADYDDNGKKTVLREGDTAVCSAGTGHAVSNEGTEVCRILALILNA